MTETTAITCYYCKKEPADGEDRFCSVCRAEDACQSLTERLTDALENFLDNRWAPHRYGQRPSYYLKEPAFEDATYREIEAAYNQVVAGTKRLIELAVGRPVKLWHGLNYEEPQHFMGICAGLEWEYEHK